MLIGIDGNEANTKKRVGVGEYSFELLRQFEEFQISNFKFQIYLKDRPLHHLPEEREGWKYRVVGPKKLWTQIGLPLDLFLHRPRPDVFFTPTHYAPRFSPVPVVISIMDLSYLRFPEMFKTSDLYQLKNWTAYSVRKAKRIFTISQASKNDIIKYYQVDAGKVVVTYPGVKLKTQMSKLKTTTQNSKLVKEKYGIEGEYILFVGTLQPRKNLVRLIEAFAQIARGPATPFPPAHSVNSGQASAHQAVYPERSRRMGSPSSRVTPRSLQLVIAGKKGWLYEEILAAPKRFGVEDKVKFLDYVPNEDLPSLYKNATCFILPSLYEGFGLPVLEAMQNGCPVIISNTSSLPEVGGEAAVYVDPEDINSIAEGMKRVLTDEKLRSDLIKKGYKQVKKFSWEKTARETLKVLEEVGRSR